MKKLAYLLLVLGFLFGAYATSLDAQTVDWPLFAVAAIAAIAGVMIAKRTDRARARSATVLESNRSALTESIGDIVRCISELAADPSLRGDALRERIDERLRPDLRRFAEARESMVHLFGLQAYADIMSDFAAGERYVNRVWSASADGYDGEARAYLARASAQFSDAQLRLSNAGAA
jgi:hypothetical protein